MDNEQAQTQDEFQRVVSDLQKVNQVGSGLDMGVSRFLSQETWGLK